MGKVIGMDLSTANSCVAVMEGGDPRGDMDAEYQVVVDQADIEGKS